MAETSLHEKMDETKRGLGERRRRTDAQQLVNTTTTHTTHNSSKNVSQWMDSVVAKARHDASMSPPLQQHSRIIIIVATITPRRQRVWGRRRRTREGDEAVYGTAAERHGGEREHASSCPTKL